MRVVVIFGALSPYHLVRMAAAERFFQERAWQLTTIERLGHQAEYLLFGGLTRSDVTIRLAYTYDNPSPSDAESCLHLQSLLKDLQPDCVVFGRSSPVYYSVLQWCLNRGLPAVLFSDSTIHDFKRSFWKEWVKRRVVKLFSAGFVAGTRQQEYLETLGMPAGSISMGYDVVDNEHFRVGADMVKSNALSQRNRLNLPNNYFLVSVRFIERKNLHGILDAYNIYSRESGRHAWGLVILGDGPMRSIYEQKVDQLGLTDRVQMLGLRNYQELPIYYGLANALILASTSEQWGLVVNEAMAAGLPILVSDRCGCVSDLVEEGINGFIFNPFDVEQMASQMMKLSSGKLDLEAMGRASLEIISKWSPDRFAYGLSQAVEQAMAAPPVRFRLMDRIILKALCPA